MDTSVSKSNFMVLASMNNLIGVDEYVGDYLINFIKLGYEKIKTKDLDIINTYRKKRINTSYYGRIRRYGKRI